METLRIIILEDNSTDAELLQFELQEAGFVFSGKVVMTEKDFIRELQEFSPDLILSDYDLPGYNGALALAEAQKRRPDTPFILVTGAISEDRAIEILTHGAKDYVLKSRLSQRLVPAVRRALAEAAEHKARKQAEADLREAHATLEERVRIRTAELEAEMAARRQAEETLRKSEEQFRTMFNTASVGMAQTDPPTGRFLRVNQKMCDITGYSAEEMLSLDVREITHPEDRDRDWSTFQRVVNGQLPDYRLEKRYLRKDGSTVWVNVNMSVICDASGLPIHTMATIEDISARKQAEQALRQSEQDYQLLAAYHKRLNDISILLAEAPDTEDLFNRIAESFRFLTGAVAAVFSVYHPERAALKVAALATDPVSGNIVHSIFGPGLFEMLIPVNADDVKTMLHENIKRPEDLCELSFGLIPREISDAVMDGMGCRQIIALAISYAGELVGTCVAYLPDDQPVVPDNALKTFISLSGMVVKRRWAEDALRESEGKYRLIAENTADVITVMDMNLRFTYVSPAVHRLRGFTVLETTEQTLDQVLTPESIRLALTAFDEEMQLEALGNADPDRRRVLELEEYHKDGSIVWIEVSISFLRDKDRKAVAMLSVARDITERKRIESRDKLALEVLNLLNNSEDTKDAIQAILKHIRQKTGIEAVGIRLGEGDDFPYYQTDGFPGSFIRQENYLCSRNEEGMMICDEQGNPVLECMCGNILCGRTNPLLPFFTAFGSFWSNCTTELLATTTEEDRQARTRNRCNSVGYESVALIPLRCGDRILGLLQLNDHRCNSFTPEMIQFFEGLCASIGIVLSRKQAEEALRESEERFRLAFATSPDAININRMSDGLFIDINTGFTRLTGYTREDVVGKTSLEISIWCDPADRQKLVEGLKEKGYYQNLEANFRRKDGTITTALMSANIILLHGVMHILSVTRDIEERKRMERQIHILNERISLATGAAQMGIWDWDIVNNRLIWDEQMYALYGRQKEEFTSASETWMKGIHPDDRTFCHEALESALQGEKNYNTEYRVVWPDGSIHFIRAMGDVHRDGDAKPLRMVGVNYDITLRKLMEVEKEKLQDQLLQSQKMESIGRLAGGVAHDFNNMLGLILGHAELAIEQVDPGQLIYADLQEIRKAADRSADLTRQLLAFARKQPVSPKVLDLNDTVAAALKMLRRLIGEDIQISWQPKAKLWPVKVDPSQIDQILANLSVNARDAINGAGKMTIETGNITFDEADCADRAGFVPGEYVLLSVSDNGCGMTREVQEKLFEPFFTTKGVGKGTGLGLATVYGIVKQNSGFIHVYSEPGHGTTFKIYLPRYAGEIGQADAEERLKPVIGGREIILIVEDEPTMVNLCRLILKKQGYQVLTAGTPGEAIQLVSEFKGEIHLLITDVVMPEMNGRDLAKKILSFSSNLKILFMSGYTADIIAQRGVLDDDVHFIQKPFTKKSFALKVREVLDKSVPPSLKK